MDNSTEIYVALQTIDGAWLHKSLVQKHTCASPKSFVLVSIQSPSCASPSNIPQDLAYPFVLYTSKENIS